MPRRCRPTPARIAAVLREHCERLAAESKEDPALSEAGLVEAWRIGRIAGAGLRELRRDPHVHEHPHVPRHRRRTRGRRAPQRHRCSDRRGPCARNGGTHRRTAEEHRARPVTTRQRPPGLHRGVGEPVGRRRAHHSSHGAQRAYSGPCAALRQVPAERRRSGLPKTGQSPLWGEKAGGGSIVSSSQ